MSRTVLIVLFALSAAALPATAADEPKNPFSTRGNLGVFALATGVTDTPFEDGQAKTVAGWDTTAFRPNGSPRVYHLYVFNPTKNKDTYTVELDAAGVKTRATVENLEPERWTRVKFAPAPAPVPVAPASPPPAPTPASTTPAAAEPPPAGRELARQPDGFHFAFRLLARLADRFEGPCGPGPRPRLLSRRPRLGHLRL